MTRTLPCLVATAVTVALLASSPTSVRADAKLPMPVLERADRALARALPMLFGNVDMTSQTLPAPSGARHSLTLGELTFHVISRLDVHCGAGLAAIIDAPTDSRLPRTGFATEAGASLVIARPAGFRLGLDINTLHVRYGSMDLTDQTMMVALSTTTR
jgi:hypothetical protein